MRNMKLRRCRELLQSERQPEFACLKLYQMSDLATAAHPRWKLINAEDRSISEGVQSLEKC